MISYFGHSTLFFKVIPVDEEAVIGNYQLFISVAV